MKGIDLHNCCIGTVSSRADHSIRASFETAELPPEFAAIILALHGCAVRILIEPLDSEEVVEVKTEKDVKTESSRLRAVFFILWKQGGQVEPFAAFYASQMEKIISHYKTKIQD